MVQKLSKTLVSLPLLVIVAIIFLSDNCDAFVDFGFFDGIVSGIQELACRARGIEIEALIINFATNILLFFIVIFTVYIVPYIISSEVLVVINISCVLSIFLPLG